MNHKGSTLSLVGTDVKTPISRNQVFMFVLSLAVVLFVAAVVFLSLSADKLNESSGEVAGLEADSARWNAMGEHYRAEALEAERSAFANTARWDAMGDHYRGETFDVERGMAANTARWNAMGEHYRAEAFDAEHSAAARTARWNAMGEWYTR
jgi:hypothetical protein